MFFTLTMIVTICSTTVTMLLQYVLQLYLDLYNMLKNYNFDRYNMFYN